MTIFAAHPRLRWAAPVAALALVGGTTLTLNRTAYADSGLPARTAAELLADLQRTRVDGLSGTVTQTLDLGLPQLPGASGSRAHGASLSPSALLSGTQTWRVWLDGPARQRLALVGPLGESDVVRNGADLWMWSSADRAAVHYTVGGHRPGAMKPPGMVPGMMPRTPDEAAWQALSAITPTTSVTTSGAAVVAGRNAYELVLTPKDTATRVAQVRIAIDAERKLPLRVQVYSTKQANPAVDVGFTAIDFTTPEARYFSFTPSPGTTVTQGGRVGPDRHPAARDGSPGGPAASSGSLGGKTATNPAPSERPTVVGTGWSAVLVGRLPQLGPEAAGSEAQRQLDGILRSVPQVSGAWGSGRVVDGTLGSAVLTDDGRVAVGMVAPERLYAALARR